MATDNGAWIPVPIVHVHPTDYPTIADIPQLVNLRRDYKRRIKLYIRHNLPAVGIWADGRTLSSTNHMNIYHTQFSLGAAMRSLSNTNETIDNSTLSALTQQCVLVPGDRNGVWYDRDGLKLVHYFPSLYKTESLQHLLIQLHNLLHVFPPSRPALYEKRSTKYQEWSEQLGPDVPTGVIRLTYHHQQGHPHDPPAASSNFISHSGIRTTAAADFRKSPLIRELSDLMSLLLASIDPPIWKKYRDAYIAMEDRFELLRECNMDSRTGTKHLHCFVGFHLVINMLTTIHRDVKEPPDGWVGMLVFGNYTRGNLCLSDLGIALPYEPGDIVFIRSWALKHFITSYNGTQRYVIVFSTTKSIFDWLQTLVS
jgi:hypothetical protein